jgi:hypothetical protein
MNERHDLVYAMRNGSTTHISDVPDSPLFCCTCPSCGEPLIPVKSNNDSYFAHPSGEPCEHGFVHSLCCAAAETIARRGKFTIPEVSVFFNTTKKPIPLSKPRTIETDSVGLIWAEGESVPEILIEKDHKKLLLVIFGEIPFDYDKLKKITDSGISSIWLDMRDVDGSMSKAEVEDIIIGDSDRKIWLYNVLESHYLELFLAASNKYRIIRHGNMLYSEFCPLAVRTRNGRPCANYFDDCCGGCEYFIYHTSVRRERINSRSDFTGDYIFCSGKQRISTLFDLMKYLAKTYPDGLPR